MLVVGGVYFGLYGCLSCDMIFCLWLAGYIILYAMDEFYNIAEEEEEKTED